MRSTHPPGALRGHCTFAEGQCTGMRVHSGAGACRAARRALVRALESLHVVDGRGECCRRDRSDAGRAAQPRQGLVLAGQLGEAAVRGRCLARPRAGLVRSVQRSQGEASERNSSYRIRSKRGLNFLAPPGTDHTREYVPLVAYSPSRTSGADLGIRESFCDLGAIVADYFVAPAARGKSFRRAVL